MAELIDKEVLREKFNNTGKVGMSHISIDKIIRDMPTTTEAEIRAKAIDEFADKLKRNFRDIGAFTGYEVKREIDEIAEQLKERE